MDPVPTLPPMCSSSTPSTSAEDKSSSSTEGSSDRQMSSTYPQIPRNQLDVQEQLGAGTFGSVFRGVWLWPNGHSQVVALKKVFMLEKEVDILSQIRHRNIIQFYGVSHANPDFPDHFIVTEYAANGSLYDYLHNASAELSCKRILDWAIQIAHGVAYLHYEAPVTIIHRDLKSRNIVIGASRNGKMECKLCDFGTSKDLTHSWTAPTWGGTAAWMSPEIISQGEGITTACDVWSYAVVLWEMFSREIPYKGLTEFKIYSIISQHGVRLVIPDTCPAPLANLLKDCWHSNPRDRIDMRQVLDRLELLTKNSTVHRECAHFVEEGKVEWREHINQQLGELDELKLDLARQMEDLKRREQALRKRETSHRNFLHMVDNYSFDVECVSEWNEDCVCEWVQNIAVSAVADISEETVDKIIGSVLQYEINGTRLLKVTEKDLENLEIEPVAVRRYIIHKVNELREINDQNCSNHNLSGCTSPTQQQQNCDDANERETGAQNKEKDAAGKLAPLNCPILLHCGLYGRKVPCNISSQNIGPTPSARFRFKVFLDSDWEQTQDGASVPAEILDSATVIKEVCISISAVNGSPVLEPVRCICPPFGYLEWVELDEQDLPANLSVEVTYTDQVIQPQNTSLAVQIAGDLSGPRTLCDETIPLQIRPTPTDTSFSRISSSLCESTADRSPVSTSTTSNGVWRRRVRSFGLCSGTAKESQSPVKCTTPAGGTILTSAQLWADLAATLRRPPRHSKSVSTEEEGQRYPARTLARQRKCSHGDHDHDQNTSASLSVLMSPPKLSGLRLPGNIIQQRQQRPSGSTDTENIVPVFGDDQKSHLNRARQVALARVRRKQQRERKSETDSIVRPREDSPQVGSIPEKRASFFLSCDSPSSSKSSSPTTENIAANCQVKQPQPVREPSKRCCANNCRTRNRLDRKDEQGEGEQRGDQTRRSTSPNARAEDLTRTTTMDPLKSAESVDKCREKNLRRKPLQQLKVSPNMGDVRKV